jgi:hypothetical protein
MGVIGRGARHLTFAGLASIIISGSAMATAWCNKEIASDYLRSLPRTELRTVQDFKRYGAWVGEDNVMDKIDDHLWWAKYSWYVGLLGFVPAGVELGDSARKKCLGKGNK